MVNFFRLAALIACLTAYTALGAQPEIREVFPSYKNAESFKTLTSYFRAANRIDHRCVVRTQRDERSGFYFVIELAKRLKHLPEGAMVKLSVISPFAPTAQEYSFPIPPQTPNKREIFVGLTGSDWPDPRATPLAWKAEILDASGETLTAQQSFLWE